MERAAIKEAARKGAEVRPRFFVCLFFIRIYSLYGGRFIVTIPIRLILYISYIAPLSLPLKPLPASETWVLNAPRGQVGALANIR
jgi:hypothetical protein